MIKDEAMSMMRLRRNAEGAVAIEYGLIAGIVALGIVSALVSTKGSLSGVFDVTGTQMNVSQAQSNSANAGFWAGKGIIASSTVVNPVDGRVAHSYVFNDGTKATYTTRSGSDPLLPAFDEVTIYDPATLSEYRVRADASGTMNLYQKQTYDPTGTYVVTKESTTSAGNFVGNPPVPTRYTSQTLDASGAVVTSSGVTNASAEHVAGSLTTNESLKYFRDIAK